MTIWKAQAFVKAARQGNTKPLFYECVPFYNDLSSESSPATFLVKALKCRSLMTRELVGNRLAQIAGLMTPEPAIICLQRDLAAKVDELLRSKGIFSSQRSGLVVGVRQLPPASSTKWLNVPATYQKDAARLYVFDMLTLNSDRTEGNPNCALVSDRILAFDFEQCFGDNPRFVEEGTPPWLVTTNDLGRHHMF